jgi:F-type H+-transporting ATPase subunit delta
MKKSKKISEIVRTCVRDVFSSGKLDQKKAEKYLDMFKKGPKLESLALLDEYKRQIKRKLDETTLVIESAADLSKADVAEIEARFKKQFVINSSLITHNPSLLGGIRVKIGDHIFDDSLDLKIKEVGEIIVG